MKFGSMVTKLSFFYVFQIYLFTSMSIIYKISTCYLAAKIYQHKTNEKIRA